LPRNIAPLQSQALHFGKPQQLFPRRLSAIDEFDKPTERKVRIGSRMQPDWIARRNMTGLNYTIVPTGSTATHHRARQTFVVEPQGELEAGLARLANLQQRLADRVNVTHAESDSSIPSMARFSPTPPGTNRDARPGNSAAQAA
jgi:hypothetical protein